MKTIGRIEHVLIRRESDKTWKRYSAKLDTGAKWSRIGAKEAAELNLGPIVGVRTIRTGGGSETRVIVPGTVRIAGHRIVVKFTVSTQASGILIGRRTMGKRFRILPASRYLTKPE